MFLIAQMELEVQVVFDSPIKMWPCNWFADISALKSARSILKKSNLHFFFSSSHRMLKSASLGGQRFGCDYSWIPQQARNWRQLVWIVHRWRFYHCGSLRGGLYSSSEENQLTSPVIFHFFTIPSIFQGSFFQTNMWRCWETFHLTCQAS